MHGRINANCFERAEIQLLDIIGRRLQNNLVLVIMLQAKRVVAVTTIGGPATWLDVGGRPGFRAHGAQERCRVKRAGAHLHVVWLHDHAAALCPVLLKFEDQVLEAQRPGRCFGVHLSCHGGFKGAKYNEFWQLERILCMASCGKWCGRPIMVRDI